MRSVLWLCALLALEALAGPPKKEKKEAAFFPYPTQVTTLKNGLTLVRVPFNSPGMVAFYTAVRVGSRNEVEAGHTGFAHFFEHMMFRGTKRYPEDSRGQLLGKLGFTENAFTTDDLTLYYVSGPSSGLETLVDVEADRFANLEYGEPAFQTEAKAVLGEYHKNAANPGLKIEETVLGAAFTAHTYRHTTLGFYEDIQAMPTRYEYSKQFFKRWYTPDNCIVVVVGDFDDAKLLELAQKHYGPWTGAAAKVAVPAEPAQKEAREAKLSWTTPTLPRAGLFWHTPPASLTKAEGALQDVLGAYLAGPTSPLYKSLVLEKQLVERVAASYDHHRDPSLFGLEARLKSEASRADVEKAMLDAVAQVAAGKIDEKRLADIKDHLRFRLAMDLDTPDKVALALAYHAAILGSPDALDSLARQTSKVTAKDLAAFAKKHLVDSNRTRLTFTVEAKGGAR